MLEFAGGAFIGEIQWSISDASSEYYAEGAYYSAEGMPIHALCLPDGCFSLNMYDSWGDGWNGAEATLTLDGVTIGETTLEDGEIGNYTFGVNEEDCEDILLEIFGCTDSEALNYNESATIDDGSCDYPFLCDEGVAAQLYVCVFGNGEQVGFELTGSDGSVVFDQNGFSDLEILTMDICLEDEVCYTATMSNNVGAYGWYGGYYWINVAGNTVSTGALQDGEEEASLIFSIDGTCGEVYGCTDPEAENYNHEATVDNGSCTYEIVNDDCENAIQLAEGTISINNAGATSSGLYGECWGFGSGEPEQNGIWFSFITPEDPALIIIEASGDGTYSLTDTQFGLYDECGGEMIDCDGNSGDGLFSMFEFPCGTLEPSTTYFLLIDGWAGNQGSCLLNYQVIEGCDSIEGCTDPEALNYNAEATINDGSCEYDDDCSEVIFTLFSDSDYPVYFEIASDSGGYVDFGELSPLETQTFIYCLPNDCYDICFYEIDESTLVLGTIIIGGEDIYFDVDDDNYCVPFGVNSWCSDEEIWGCTDPEAINYNPLATIDDSSCIYIPDGDCQASFEILSIDEDEDVMYILNTSTFGWGIEYLWDFGDGSTSTAPLPIHTYTDDGEYTICLTISGPDECEDTFCMDIFYESPGFADPNGFGANNEGFTINVVNEEANAISSNGDLISLLQLYPNPTSNVVNVDYVLKTGSEVVISIYDITGSLLIQEYIMHSSGLKHSTLEVEKLSPGLYFLELSVNGAKEFKRFDVLK